MSALMPFGAVGQMARQLSTPFGRGADTLLLTLLAQASASHALVAGYDFLEHRALYDQLPAPRYILVVQRDVTADTQVTIEYTAQTGGPAQPPLVIDVPAGTYAGSSFALDLGANEGPFARLTKLTMTPSATDGEAAQSWQLIVLLGNTAKLLWVLGWERDHIRRQLARTTAQRQLANALGASLDLIGYDLGIPRFPPLPYSFDTSTIALYHLNDQPGAVPAAEDSVGRYPGQPGHPGAIVGSVGVGVPGRFGNGFALLAPTAAVEIPDHADFNLAVSQSFTAECFFQPLRSAPDGQLLSKHADPASNQAGWALSAGDFGRGLPLNVRWLLSDGVNPPLVLFADLSLSPDRFTHLAGVLDRQAGLARLYVDGQLVAQATLGNLQAISTAAPVRIGSPSAALQGVVEEVRLSRVARSDFYPALGESDQSYRQRLRFFRRWVLPTPAHLLALLNEAIGAVNGDLAPLIVNDANTTIIGGATIVTIDPLHLLPGTSMDAAGNRQVREAAVCGTVADEPLFSPAFLLTHNDPRASYTAPELRVLGPNEPPPDAHKLQLVVERALNRLLDLAAPEAGAGTLVVESAFDPRAPDLRATGRALLLRHTTIALGRLAALAHRAGFSFVAHRGDLDMVYASCAAGEYLEIVATGAAGVSGIDGVVGDVLTLTVRPALPSDTSYRWLTIACGQGQARFSGPQTQASATIQISAPGTLTVKLDATRRRSTVSATRTLRLGIKDLANGGTISSDGRLGASEPQLETPPLFFHPAVLTNHNDARATYGANPNTHLMQAALAARLTRLLDLLAAGAVAGKLQISSAYAPAATDLTSVGRGLSLRHSSLAAGPLAALAYAAGFSFVQCQGATVLVRQSADQLVALQGPQQVDEGGKITLAAAIKPGGLGPATRLQWSLGGAQGARLSSTTQPSVDLYGVQAGMVRVQALYLIGDNPAPYSFEVRLKPALEAVGAIIRKEQYDLVMNLLNAFHPIGVEVSTRALRERVVELQGSILEANPDYTYPKYRVRGPAPRQRKEPTLG